MNIPEDLRYSPDHEWVRMDSDAESGPFAWVGITDYAQDALGDVVYIDLPAIGATVSSGESFGEVESTKSVSHLFAPISGTVARINEVLAERPGLVNEDPFGDGWLCTVTPADPDSVDALLDAAAYETLITGD